MKLSKKEERQIIKQLLPLLMPLTELYYPRETVYCRKGTDIVCDKTAVDAVLRQRIALVPSEAPVNHERRIKKIIADVRDKAAMVEELGKYLAKHGHRKPEEKPKQDPQITKDRVVVKTGGRGAGKTAAAKKAAYQPKK